MKKSTTLAAAVATVTLLGGTGVRLDTPLPATADDAGYLAALLNPVDIARQLCSGTTDQGYAGKRAVFLHMARLQAAEIAPPAAPSDPPPLWDGLGDLSIDITTDSTEARAYFNQGLRIANDFNHLEAVRSFRWAQVLDPGCAMCYWGEALALGPNINAPMDPTLAPRAHEAAQHALALREGASAKEQALIEALATRYGPDAMTRRAQQDNAYAKAMLAVARQYPDDDEVLTLAAEALMDAQPWDYWEADYRTPKGRTAEVLALLETVLARNPDHAPAIHLYIHVTEASDNPYRAEAGADRLAGLAPAAGHLVHMPSHTYHRVGRDIDAYRLNVVAVAANEAYLVEAQASPVYEYGYYTHNLHSALTSAQMAGDADAVLRLADKLDAKMPASMVRLAPWVQAIKVAPYFAYAQFAASEAIMELPDPGMEFPYLRTMWHYARGEAMARSGEFDAAFREAAAAEALADHPAMRQLAADAMPAPTLARIAADIVRARAEIRAGDLGSAIGRLENAAERQGAMFYSEPSYWYFPVNQMLGAALLLDGQAHRAEAVFIRSLVDAPNNGRALYGLQETQKALGNEAAANYAGTLFRQAWLGEADAIGLDSL